MRPLAWAAAAAIGVAAAALATTHGFGLLNPTEPTSTGGAARQRCERDVATRMVTPATAKISGVAVTASQLDPEVTDLSSLAGGPLAGVAHFRISVQSVTGVVETPSEVGGMLRDAFTCRAYFLDGELADTLVVLDHDH